MTTRERSGSGLRYVPLSISLNENKSRTPVLLPGNRVNFDM